MSTGELKISRKRDLEISVQKTRTMAFQEKYNVRIKILQVVTIEQVTSFNLSFGLRNY